MTSTEFSGACRHYPVEDGDPLPGTPRLTPKKCKACGPAWREVGPDVPMRAHPYSGMYA